MYIKSVTISGFRSYKETVSLDDFSPRVNLVIGENGSGKSNFFTAIQLLLTSTYDNIGVEEREQLVYQGAGTNVLSGSVEILFENSDGRIPVDTTEVSIKRVFSSKSDQYYINGKQVKRRDLSNLLESIGISKSNPYYIVKQGKIMQLSNMKDGDRLKLLREIAGASVYDEKKQESLEILNEAQKKRKEIETFLNDMSQKLEVLNSEKAELDTFDSLVRRKRSIEHQIYTRQISKIDEKVKSYNLVQVEDEYKSALYDYDSLQARRKEKYSVMKTVQDTVKKLRAQISALKYELNMELLPRIEKYKASREFSEIVVHSANQDITVLHEQIDQLDQTINNEIIPRYNDLISKEEDCVQKIKLLKEKKTVFSALEKMEFRTKRERNKWIEQELKSQQIIMRETEEAVISARNSLEELKNETQVSQKELPDINKVELLSELQKELLNLKDSREHVVARKRRLMQHEVELLDLVTRKQNKLHSATEKFRLTVSKSLYKGIETLEKLSSNPRLRTYGLLLDNLTFDDAFCDAISSIGGRNLFNVIVDDTDMVSEILTIMNQSGFAGEISFMPANMLSTPKTSYTFTESMRRDCVPLKSRVSLKPEVAMYPNLLSLVFENALLCKDLEVAVTYSKLFNVNCVTLEGDKCSNKGSINGGYFNPKYSRIRKYLKMRKVKSELQELQKQLEEVKREIHSEEAKIDGFNLNIYKQEEKILSSKNNEKREYLDYLNQQDIKSKQSKEISDKQAIIMGLEAKINSVGVYIDELKSAKASLNKNIGETSCDNEIGSLHEKCNEYVEERMKVNKERVIQEARRSELLAHRDEYYNSTSLSMGEGLLLEADADIQRAEARKESITDQIENINGEITKNDAKIATLNGELEALRLDLEEMARERKAKLDIYDSCHKKVQFLLQKRKECENSMNVLGGEAELCEFDRETSLKELWASFREVNEDLKKYEVVNKKSRDQYNSLFKQHKDLLEKRDEINSSFAAIENMMDVLEERKNNTIMLTYRQVSLYFSQTFKEMVPNGCAQMTLMYHKSDNVTSDQDISGISLSVSFTNSEKSTHRVNQLSGGQKTIVSLALIFAIQQCDPSPFYFFDEVDQALDSEFRSGVAKMMRKLSNFAQFICTTFRPELIAVSDRFFHVTHDKTKSSVKPLGSEEALQFFKDVHDDNSTAFTKL